MTRETREGLTQVTVETEAMGTLGIQMKSVRRAGTIYFCPAMAALVSQYNFLSLYTISVYVSPSPSNLGRQSCRAACLWMCVSGCDCNFQTMMSTNGGKMGFEFLLCMCYSPIQYNRALHVCNIKTYTVISKFKNTIEMRNMPGILGLLRIHCSIVL